MGDFNATRGPNEKIGGSNKKDSYSNDLNDYCHNIELEDLRFIGNFFL